MEEPTSEGILTQPGDVQHVGNAPVAHVHLGYILLPTLFHYLLQRLGHFSETQNRRVTQRRHFLKS